MPNRSRATRIAAPTRFTTDERHEEYDVQDDGDGNVADLVSLLQEYKKKKSMKASSKSSVFTAKKNTLISSARQEVDILVNEGSTYLDGCRERVKELREQEKSSDELLQNAVKRWAECEDAFQSTFKVFPELIEELSPYRSECINAASEMLEDHPRARDISRRRLMKSARRHMEMGMENQRVATDASALIKHYKALLLL